MKKWSILLLIGAMMLALLAGCGAQNGGETAPPEKDTPTTDEQPAPEVESGAYADGIYFAQEDQFSEKSGWKYMVLLTVQDGKIIEANWTGAHKNGGPDKKESSKSGQYGMKAGGAQSEWHEQAELMEKALIEKQDPKAIAVKEDGKTDAVSGVSITVKEFTSLAEKALAAGPTQPGPFKDGAYHAEGKEFDAKSGWKGTMDLTVVNGTIVAANWDAVHKDGGDTKKKQSAEGKYGMKAGGAQSEWHEQAAIMEQALLDKQDPKAIALKEDGTADAISGVSIHVGEFVQLAEEALANAK
ncbi:hypothetical protein PAE9249_02807 [Paenibacillus sp. CECT 9249]|uniref:FMN-binding protein n=1 Tax=Paenibacillus sp. CECT 9249 TaxID=2845385 RepID=UPI001E330309|nr:FMN-binding protein [Paenibacillus sp. CECT 9249]CAH0120290.1 hypothetical protein PAE9249_02807 [Paenibacillus sp. CECT 9249]